MSLAAMSMLAMSMSAMSISRRAWRRLAGLGLMAMLVAGCSPWIVLRQSGPPSALRGATHIHVSFDYSLASLGGKSEELWLASQPPHDQEAYFEVRRNIEAAFVSALSRNVSVPVAQVEVPGAEPGGAVCIVRVMLIEQGKYAVFFAMDSRLDAYLEWAPGGEPVSDTISVELTVTANIATPTIMERMIIAGERLGERAGRFFESEQAR